MFNKRVVKKIGLVLQKGHEVSFRIVLTLQLALTTAFFHENIKLSSKIHCAYLKIMFLLFVNIRVKALSNLLKIQVLNFYNSLLFIIK